MMHGIALGMLMLVEEAHSHGAMLRPIPRNNENAIEDMDESPGCVGEHGNGACSHSFETNCIIGCDCMPSENGCSRRYGQNVTETCPCDTIMEPTHNDPATRAWNVDGKSPFGDWTRYHPWRAPGHARLTSPCPGNYPPHAQNLTETWVAGGTAWAWWSIAANHGGGYQYRLCPKSKALTNECFEERPLEFATEYYTIRYSATVGITDVVGKPDVVARATELSSGTIPVGSTWRRMPLPGCNCDSVGAGCSLDGRCEPGPYQGIGSKGSPTGCHASYEQQEMPSWYQEHVASGGFKCENGFQFPAPAKGIYGAGFPNTFPSFRFGDELRVPDDEGEYVLQWRWDCEESSQIWASCADIEVRAGLASAPTPVV